ncbi:MAG: hypothetical protein HY290_09820, partial [Planctomycetia bacterium]|nr:hypothetical protein [Planctomycetia bacterium]
MLGQLMEMPASDSEIRIDLGGWPSLTWEDVEEWAGSRNVSRGRSYQRRGHVREMIVTAEGRLMATVVGNAKYQVSVWRAADKTGAESLQSHCTCPVGHKHCKHA